MAFRPGWLVPVADSSKPNLSFGVKLTALEPECFRPHAFPIEVSASFGKVLRLTPYPR